MRNRLCWVVSIVVLSRLCHAAAPANILDKSPSHFATLNGQINMLFIDLPGYGQSDHPRTDYTMDLFAKGINAAMEDAKVSEVILIGHSMGVPVVRQSYRLYPAKTKALILVDGALRPFTKDPAEAEKWVSRFQEETFKENAPKMLAGMIPADNTALREH